MSRLEETVGTLKTLLTEAEKARDAREAECQEVGSPVLDRCCRMRRSLYPPPPPRGPNERLSWRGVASQLKAANEEQKFQLAANSREIERLRQEEKLVIGKLAILERERDLSEAADGSSKASSPRQSTSSLPMTPPPRVTRVRI